MSTKIAQHIIDQIRRAKRDGSSLKEVAARFHISKSTVSTYCRDLFQHPQRIYETEADTRARLYQRSKANKIRYRQDGRSQSWSKFGSRSTQPCRVCDHHIRRGGKSGLCASCFNVRDRPIKVRPLRVSAGIRAMQRVPAAKPNPCGLSPTGAHHFLIIDSIGTCKWYDAQRDFHS